MASVLHAAVQRGHIGYGDIDVVGEEAAIEHRGLSTLADARGDPFALIHGVERLVDVVKVIERVLHRQIVPVAGVRHRLFEVAILHKDDIGVEQFGQLLDVALVEGVARTVSFRHEHGGTVETPVAEHHALLESTLRGVLAVKLLLDEEHILLGERRTLQRLHITHSRQRCESLACLSQFCRQHLQGQHEEHRDQHQGRSPLHQFLFHLYSVNHCFVNHCLACHPFAYHSVCQAFVSPTDRLSIITQRKTFFRKPQSIYRFRSFLTISSA